MGIGRESMQTSSAKLKKPSAVLDIAGVSKAGSDVANSSRESLSIYNVVSPSTFSWSKDFVLAVRTEGIEFDSIPFESWIAKLQDSGLNPEQNPSARLLSFWKASWNERPRGRDFMALTVLPFPSRKIRQWKLVRRFGLLRL